MRASQVSRIAAWPLLAAAVVTCGIAFVMGATDGGMTSAVLVASAGGVFTGMLLHRPAPAPRAPDRQLTFRTTDQLRAARLRLMQSRDEHAAALKARSDVRRRLADLRSRMCDIGLSAYSSRIATIDRGLATLDRQIAVITRLRDGYDRSIRMIDIELDAGYAADELSEDVGASVADAMFELRALEASQADLERQLEANIEVERLLA